MSKPKDAEKKQGFFTRLKKNFRLSYSELKKVHWPSRPKVVSYTWVVMVTVAIVTTILWVFDSGITLLFGLFV